MSLHNSCAGNKPVITGGWGSGQAGRGARAGEGGQSRLPAPLLGFRPHFLPRPPRLRCLNSLCKRELLHSWKLGSTSKGRSPPCLPKKPRHPKPGARVAWPGMGKPRHSGPVGKPRPLCDIGPTELSATLPGCPRSPGALPASIYPLTTPGETPGTGRDTRPATRQPAGPRRASPLVSGRA